MKPNIGDVFEWTYRGQMFFYEVVSDTTFRVAGDSTTSFLFTVDHLNVSDFEEYFAKINTMPGHYIRWKLSPFQQFVKETLEEHASA